MEAQELASLVEFSEARAYASLMQCAPRRKLNANGIETVNIGSALALVATSVSGSLNMNRVIGLGIAEPATETMVDGIADLYRPRGLSFGIEAGPLATPSDLTGWLRARCIRRGVGTAMHYRVARPIAQEPDREVQVIRAPRSSIREVADICCSVFRMPKAAHMLIEGTADQPGWRQWLAICNGEPVGAALSFVGERVGWLGWDATLPAFRGRGIQSALIGERVTEAALAGCDHVTSETAVNGAAGGDPSFRNYQRAGFSVAYERATYVGLQGTRGTRA